MAALSGTTQLVAFSSQNHGFQYIEDGPGIDRLITTSSDRHITLISQRSLLNWSAKSGQTVTRGAVYTSSTKQYAAILNKQVCRVWTEEEKDLSKAQKVALPKSAHCLVRVEDGLLVIYEDSTVSHLNSVNEITGEVIDEEVRWVGARQIEDGTVAVIVTQNFLQVYNITEANITSKKINVPVGNVIDMCLHQSDGQLYLITVALDGQLSQITVNGSACGEVTKLQRVDGLTDHVGITSLGSTYIALAGLQQDGQEGVCVWDLRYGIPVWTPLPDATTHSKSQCCVRGSRLVVLCSKAVYVVKFTIKPPSLADALGKFTSSSLKKTTVEDDECLQLFSALCDPVKTKTKKQFVDKFTKLLGVLKPLGEKNLIYQSELKSLVRRCLSEEAFWPGNQIHELIKANLVPASLCSELFEAVAKREELAILHSGLSHLHNIPEMALLASLACLLRVDENKFVGLMDEEMESTAEDESDEDDELPVTCPFSKIKAAFINQVLVLPFNDVFMVECLRKFEFSQSLDESIQFQYCGFCLTLVLPEQQELLRYLQYLLVTASKGNSDANPNQPTLFKVVDWASVLLDAHFTQFVLSSDARSALIELHQLVESQVQFFDGLVSLEGILNQLKAKCGLPQKHNPGLYNIHTLHIY